MTEVWGVGRRSAAKLASLNIQTAWDLSQFDVSTLRKHFGVTMKTALEALDQIYRPGYAYAKCAVHLMNLSQRGELTVDLFAPAPKPGTDRLMQVMDEINQKSSRGTLRPGRVPALPGWGMRRDMLSRRATTD